MKKTALFFLIMTTILANHSACSQKTNKFSSVDIEKIGVISCDDYLVKYQKCIEKVPQAAQLALKSGLAQTATQWKKISATPEGKNSLPMSCKVALDSAKQAMSYYGCEW